ncbi:hypothetical protein TGRUB_362530 [Toxoplasma gondii RUB]|uniref:Uncharacterized protein n=1 Tax=Toxoplasma gondii RUB TaxID=935652 RepID=A0A086M7P1_TOXGO|nr:hypothetical protein TGRUB_362530 [Toxoplasma gondii RUB]
MDSGTNGILANARESGRRAADVMRLNDSQGEERDAAPDARRTSERSREVHVDESEEREGDCGKVEEEQKEGEGWRGDREHRRGLAGREKLRSTRVAEDDERKGERAGEEKTPRRDEEKVWRGRERKLRSVKRRSWRSRGCMRTKSESLLGGEDRAEPELREAETFSVVRDG